MSILRWLPFCALLCLSTAPAPAATPSPHALSWHRVATVKLGTPDDWDFVYLDPEGRNVYVAHGNKISVVDVRARKLVATLGPIAGAHDAAIVPSVGRLYVDNGDTGKVTVFDARSRKRLGEIVTEPDSDAMLYDSSSNILIVANGDSGTASLINPGPDKVVATVKVGPGLEGIATDGRGHAFINISGGDAVARLDLMTHQVDRHWSLQDCPSPHGLAMDRQTGRLFIACHNKTMLVIDSETGKTIASLPIGRGNDGAAFDPVRKRVFASNKDGTISVIAEDGPNAFRAMPSIPTAAGAGTLAEDPQTGRIYVVTAALAKVLPSKHGGMSPEYAFIPGTVHMLILAPSSR